MEVFVDKFIELFSSKRHSASQQKTLLLELSVKCKAFLPFFCEGYVVFFEGRCSDNVILAIVFKKSSDDQST